MLDIVICFRKFILPEDWNGWNDMDPNFPVFGSIHRLSSAKDARLLVKQILALDTYKYVHPGFKYFRKKPKKQRRFLHLGRTAASPCGLPNAAKHPTRMV